MFKRLLVASLFALLTNAVAFAQSDPSVHEIYAAAEAGHLGQARDMIDQVLKDHPNSAKAHYISAELFARQGDVVDARTELNKAERLQPGLPFAKAESVTALKAQLRSGGTQRYLASRSDAPSMSWGLIGLVVLAVVAVIWFVRRRSEPTMSYSSTNPSPVINGGPQPYSTVGTATPGMGSTIAGGLASGLAVGAGVVAGEEIARHLLNRDSTPTPQLDSTREADSPNPNMGGADFGVADNNDWGGGDSFDGGAGGDDWG